MQLHQLHALLVVCVALSWGPGPWGPRGLLFLRGWVPSRHACGHPASEERIRGGEGFCDRPLHAGLEGLAQGVRRRGGDLPARSAVCCCALHVVVHMSHASTMVPSALTRFVSGGWGGHISHRPWLALLGRRARRRHREGCGVPVSVHGGGPTMCRCCEVAVGGVGAGGSGMGWKDREERRAFHIGPVCGGRAAPVRRGTHRRAHGALRDRCPSPPPVSVRKILGIRLWPSKERTPVKAWDLSVSSSGLEVLCVSQFTLYGRLSGNKPDYSKAMAPGPARAAYDAFVARLRESYVPERVRDGAFGAMMDVALVNDGPVTWVLDSADPGNTSGVALSEVA